MVQVKRGPAIKNFHTDYKKSSKVSCEDPKHRAKATKSLGKAKAIKQDVSKGISMMQPKETNNIKKSNIYKLQKLHSTCHVNVKANWSRWNIWFLTWAMKYPDVHAWLTTGVTPVFITEDMEEWLEIEGHPEMVVKNQWRGRQGESRWTSLHRGNESRASKFLREAGLTMEMLFESIDEEIFDALTMDVNFTMRWRQKDVYFIYCLAHQAAVKDYQLSVYFNLQCLFEMELINDDYQKYFIDFNNMWEDVLYACPDPGRALREWLSGKVAHDMCSAVGEDFDRLHDDVVMMIGEGRVLPDHEVLIRKWTDMLRQSRDLRQVGPNRSKAIPVTEGYMSSKLEYMYSWTTWLNDIYMDLKPDCKM